MPRITQFGVYNFFVSIIAGKALGGFSAVSGSQIKVVPPGDRAGNEAANRPEKIREALLIFEYSGVEREEAFGTS